MKREEDSGIEETVQKYKQKVEKARKLAKKSRQAIQAKKRAEAEEAKKKAEIIVRIEKESQYRHGV